MPRMQMFRIMNTKSAEFNNKYGETDKYFKPHSFKANLIAYGILIGILFIVIYLRFH